MAFKMYNFKVFKSTIHAECQHYLECDSVKNNYKNTTFKITHKTDID